MAKPQNQPLEQPGAAESAEKLKQVRSNTMSEMAFRASQSNSPQVSPSATPSSKNVTASGNPELSQAVREQWNVPQEQQAQPSKASLQDVRAIGQSLKNQGVTTSEAVQPESKAKIENSFDNSTGNGSTLRATDRAVQEAKQSLQQQKSQSHSTGWER